MQTSSHTSAVLAVEFDWLRSRVSYVELHTDQRMTLHRWTLHARPQHEIWFPCSKVMYCGEVVTGLLHLTTRLYYIKQHKQYTCCKCTEIYCLWHHTISLVPRLPRSGTRTLKLCRRGEPGILCHMKSAKDRKEVERT